MLKKFKKKTKFMTPNVRVNTNINLILNINVNIILNVNAGVNFTLNRWDFAPPAFQAIDFTPLLSPSGDLGIGMVWDNHPTRPHRLFGPTVEILFKLN